MTVQSYPGYVVTENRDGKFRLAFPIQSQSYYWWFIGIVLLIWIPLEVAAIAAVVDGRTPAGAEFWFFGTESRTATNPYFMVYWLIGSTIGGLILLGFLACGFFGKEIIELDAQTLTRHKRILGLGRSRTYRVAAISELRSAAYLPPESPGYVAYQWHFPLSFRNGGICFDYGRATHFLGSGLDEEESRYVIEEMRKRVKSLRPPDRSD